MHTANEIFQAALTLPEEARLTLIEELFGSLGEGPRKDIWDRWSFEAEDRILAFERGEIEAFPGEQVIAELRTRQTA
ncbi:MAG: addiction module protein [bacterium]|nr:addiction module protein [bacterium]